MKKLEGLDRVTEILTTYFAQEKGINVDIRPSSDFFYYPGEDIATYALLVADNLSQDFFKNALYIFNTDSRFNMLTDFIEYNSKNIFLLSFLHEIGHYQTYDEITEEEYQLSKDMKAAGGRLYYLAPDEYEATAWAMRFYFAHKEELENLWEFKLEPAINNFYVENEVDFLC